MKGICVLVAIAVCGCSSSKPTTPSLAAAPADTEPAEPPGPLAELRFTIPNTNPNGLESFRGAAISPDGATVATSLYGEPVKLWNVSTGKVRHELDENKGAREMRFSPDGKTLAAVGWAPDFKANVLFWDTDRWERTAFPYDGRIDRLTFSPDGTTVLTSGISDGINESRPTLWDVASRAKLKSVEPLKGQMYVTFSADSKLLFWPRGEVGVWDIAAEKELPPLQFKGFIAASPDGRTLFIGKQLVDWMAAKVERELPLRDLTTEAAFSPSGRVLATTDLTGVKLWEVATGKELFTVCGPDDSSRSLAIQFARGGRHLLTRGLNEVKVWKYRGG
jgi:WD40 repeat protein